MKRTVKDVMLALLVLGALIFALPNYIQAEEADDLAQELIDEGVSQDVINELSNVPGDTMGQRLDGMLKNGSVSERQYDKIYNNFINLPQEKRWAIKGAYDKGYGNKVYDRMVDKAHQQAEDPSLRDHIKDLKQQGLSREEVHERLRNEGVPLERLKDISFGQEGSRPEHAKDIRDMGTEESQHKVDRIHEKRQDRREDVRDRKEDIRDRKEDIRDRREDIRDHREDIWDAKHDGGRRDKLEDIRDRREDIRDRQEDIKDRREDVRDRREDRKDKRDNAGQPRLDRGHEKYQDKTGPAGRVDHAKDRSGYAKEKPRLKEGAHNQRGGGGGGGRKGR